MNSMAVSRKRRAAVQVGGMHNNHEHGLMYLGHDLKTVPILSVNSPYLVNETHICMNVDLFII
jgi:hypothetical protein